ncbi:DUF3667 domain-containing protein [Aestuariivivens sediminicola]|uniref:DUF3667 domain-containing protein n=1 Tax=Aestuariivivens sediminicola TaxID=2913560 RepID=UPI001F5875AF|nr:DUF3667 domain-containing protein [Aestuariivivens sediminicola]
MCQKCHSCESLLSDEMKFCPNCGEPISENTKPHRLKDFFNEFINYDANIWRTLKILILKPGKSTGEFINGNNQKVTSPAKIFIILSAVAFLVGTTSVTTSDSDENNEDQEVAIASSLKERPGLELEMTTGTGIKIKNIKYYKKEIDSLGAKQFLVQRDFKANKFTFWLVERTIKKYQENNYKEISYNHERNASFLLYLLIPLFAFIMKLFRWKRSFTEHITFTLYFFSTFYLCMMLQRLIWKILSSENQTLGLYIVIAILVILPLVYLVIAIHRNYNIKWIYSSIIGLFSGMFLLISLVLLLLLSPLLIISL